MNEGEEVKDEDDDDEGVEDEDEEGEEEEVQRMEGKRCWRRPIGSGYERM